MSATPFNVPGEVSAHLREPDPELDPQLLPKQLSPSRAGDFDQCPKKFFYGSILRIGSPPSRETTIGTLSHYAFEYIFDQPKSERTIENAQALVAVGWAELLRAPEAPAQERSADAPETLEERSARHARENALAYRELAPEGSAMEADILETARAMVAKWFATEAVDRIEPLGREVHLYLQLGEEHHNAPVHGIIDRVDQIEVAGEKRLYLSDYKTGTKVPDDRWMSKNFRALRLYSALAEAEYGLVPHAMRLVYVVAGSGQGVKTERVSFETLEEAKKFMGEAWKGMQDAALSGVWPAKTSRLCDWCAFQPHCPEGLAVAKPR